jgi:hypothetical protein
MDLERYVPPGEQRSHSIDGGGQRAGIHEVDVIDMWRRDDGSRSRGHGGAGELQRGWFIRGPVVEAGEEMHVQVNHER